jgi:hypothetical protein
MTKQYFFLIVLLVLAVQFNACREDIIAPAEDNSTSNNDSGILKEIIKPAEGDVWESGNNYYIQWNSSNKNDEVKIELVRKFNYILTISSSTKNDGEHLWTVPHDLPYQHHYRIRLIPIGANTDPIHSVEFDIREKL